MEFSGPDTGVSSFSLLQGIFPTQGSNPGLLHCRQILDQLSHKGSLEIKIYALLWVSLIASLIAQLVKNLPAKQENPVQFLGGGDLLEKG